LVVDD